MATVTSSKRQLTHTSNTYESNGDVTIGGNLNINGTTTTIDTANLLVEDKNIIIGDVSSPTDVTADFGGITLKGATDKTINWVNSTNAWTSNQIFSAPNLTLTSLLNQSSEATALVVNGSNVVGTRELGSNAFNSTSFLTSYTETDTLATVLARGATSTQSITSLNTNATSLAGLSIGESFANYDGWNSQLNVHGGSHSRLNVKTSTVRMGVYAHNSWHSISASVLNGYVGTYTNHGLGFLVNSSPKMVINTSGQVGINQTSPTSQLHVGGVIAATGGNSTNWNTAYTHTSATNNPHSVTKSQVGLSNVTNESKATMFASPTFTGTVSGVTKSHVGLGSVANESKATMFTNAALTGNPTATTQSSNENSTKIATTSYVKAQGYITSANGGNATTLDGIDSSAFLRSNAADTASGAISFTGGHGAINITNSSILSSASSNWTGDPGGAGKIQYHSNRWYIVSDSSSDRIVQFRRNNTNTSYIHNNGTFIGNVTGNVSGNVSGSSGSCTGNAATATTLANARTIAGTSFNGSANISISYNNLTNKPTIPSAYSLPLASSSTRGGVKIGYSESGKNYPVELSSEKMYVNVPWTDTDTNTVYTHPTSAGNKHVPTGGASGQFLKYSSSGTATWATPSYTTNTDTNTTYSAGSGLNLSGTTFRLKGGEIPSGVNLNTYRTTGVYSQNSNADATAGSNWPANAAGILEVWNDDYGNGIHCTQRYSQYNTTNVYNRNYYNGTWTAWRDLTQDTNTVYTLPSNVVIDSSNYSVSNRIRFRANETNNWDTIATTSGSQGCIEIFNTVSGNDAFMAFHAGGDYAGYFGLDADTNDLAWGGWSVGAVKHRMFHAGNSAQYTSSLNTKLGGIAASANNYSLPAGSSSTRGGFKIGYSESGKNYPVELSSEKMYVNVPWSDTNTNTTYSGGTGITLSGTTFNLTDTAAKLNLSGGTLTGTLNSRDIKLASGYYLMRSSHHTGHLEGSYNNIGANGAKSNPIYTIGSSYNPSDAALGNMYGIGYASAGSASFVSLTGATGWGMYVAADGDARIFLDAQYGKISSTGEHYVGSSRVFHDTYHPNADILTTTRNIALAGDVTGNVNFNGSGNVSITTALAANSVGSSEIATDAVGASEIAANAVRASELSVSGNGTTAQFLRSDGDGTFTWATPTDTNTDTNTTYSAGTGLTLSGTTFSITDTISDGASNSTIVKRKSGGYIFANYFNTTPNTWR